MDRESQAATHASGRNAGMFRQLYREPQLSSWAERSRESWPEEIKQQTFQQCGSLIVGREPTAHSRELFKAIRIHSTQAEPQGVPTQAVYTETDGLLDSPNFVQGLARLFVRSAGQLRLRSAVIKCEFSHSEWRVGTSDEVFRAKYLVSAAGAWCGNLSLGSLRLRPQAFARHLFVVGGFPEDYMPQLPAGFYWDEVNSWYMRRWSESERLVSICEQIPSCPESYRPTESCREVLAEKLLSVLPEIAPTLSLKRAWHCFRTYYPDQLPVWGPDPANANLFWLSGFGGFGMSTGFAAAEDAARYICGENPLVSKSVLAARYG